MRAAPRPKLRAAALALCGIGIAAGLASFGLAFSVKGPSRTLRPILTYADSAYLPLYLGMTAAGVLTLACLIGLLSLLWGNRAVDLGACIALLVAAGLALATLGLAGSLKGSAQSGLEAALSESLKRYGRDDPAAFDAWDELQSNTRCCAVRTNMAQQAYEATPWYKELRKGNPYNAPKIPISCCTDEARATPSKQADCTNNKPALPAQNPFMHPLGCFDSMGSRLDTFSTRFIIIGVIVFLGAGAALGVLAYGLVLTARQGGSAAADKQQQQFTNSRPGSVAGSGIEKRSQQPLMSQSLRSGPSVYSSHHSLVSEPAPRPPSETSLPSLAGRSLFSEPPVRAPIQAQPVRPRQHPAAAHQHHQQQQQPPVPKPRSSHSLTTASIAGSVAEPSLGGYSQSDVAANQGSRPQAPLQAQPMKKQQQPQQKQQPIVLAAQPLRSQPPRSQPGGRQPAAQAARKRQSNF